MKYIFIIIYLCLLQTQCFAQLSKEAAFILTARKVIDAFSKQDSVALAKLVENTAGVYFLYHGNTYLEIVHLDVIRFFAPGRLENKLQECKGIEMQTLQYATLPTQYNCDSERWDKFGLFVDTTVIDHAITNGCAFKNKYEPGSYTQKQIRFFADLENNSRRIILQDHHNRELVFYLAFINHKWYLTIIDKSNSECSV